MNILTHDWNGYGIAQVKEQTEIASYSIPTGYVNATQMCQANGKQLGHYKELKITQQYLVALAADLDTSVEALVVEIDCSGRDQGTWVHLEIAVDVSRWLGYRFHRWFISALSGKDPSEIFAIATSEFLAGLATASSSKIDEALRQYRQSSSRGFF